MNDADLLLLMAGGLRGSARHISEITGVEERGALRMIALLVEEGSVEKVGMVKNTLRAHRPAQVFAITSAGMARAATIAYHRDPDGDIAGYDGA